MSDPLLLADEELAAAARNNREAFSELYRRHIDSIFRYMRYQTSCVEEAQDLTAQVFFQAYRAAGQFRGQGASYGSWLFRIAHNTLRSWYRGRSKRPVPVAEIPDRPDHNLETDTETRDVVREVVSDLDIPDRELIVLRYVEGLAPKEIASATGSTDGATRVRLHRLLRKLRRTLEQRGVHL